MRRPHRSIETFDISLMAVVTKAMGAFLVLMLLLMPYYSSSPLGKDEALRLAQKVQDADNRIGRALDQMSGTTPEVTASLMEARKSLGSGQDLINLLKRAIDQLSSQVTRLEEKIATLTAENAQLKRQKNELERRVSTLEKDNANLKTQLDETRRALDLSQQKVAALEKERDDLKAQVSALQAQVAALTANVAELERQVADLQAQLEDRDRQIEELKKEIEELKKKIAELEQPVNAQLKPLLERIKQLEKENAELRAQVAALQGLVASLQQQVAALTQQVAQLQGENARLTTENAALNAQIEELQQELDKTVKNTAIAVIALPDCSGHYEIDIVASGIHFHNKDDSSYFLETGDGFGRVFRVTDNDFGYTNFASAKPDRYFLFLVFREAETGSNSDFRIQSPPSKCDRIRIYVTAANEIYGAHKLYNISPTKEKPIQYVGDVLIADDLEVTILDPSPEGRVWAAGHSRNITAPGRPPAGNILDKPGGK